MPSDSIWDSPPAPSRWATPADRQEAARQAYRQSMATGRPLNGVQLGTMFDRSPRWGVDRIAEVRSEDISRSNGNHADDVVLPIGNHRNGHGNASSSASPLDGNNGNGTHVGGDPGAQGRRRNSSRIADSAAPIRNNGSSMSLPIGNFGNGAHTEEPLEGLPYRERQAVTDSVAAGCGDASPPTSERQSRPWLDTVITLLVAVVAFAASYGHMLDVALMAGEPLWIARAFPVTVDGLVLAALRRGDGGRGWLALAAAISVAANVLAQFPEQAAAAGPVVSAWPPVALYGTHRLLHARRRAADPATRGSER